MKYCTLAYRTSSVSKYEIATGWTGGPAARPHSTQVPGAERGRWLADPLTCLSSVLYPERVVRSHTSARVTGDTSPARVSVWHRRTRDTCRTRSQTTRQSDQTARYTGTGTGTRYRCRSVIAIDAKCACTTSRTRTRHDQAVCQQRKHTRPPRELRAPAAQRTSLGLAPLARRYHLAVRPRNLLMASRACMCVGRSSCADHTRAL